MSICNTSVLFRKQQRKFKCENNLIDLNVKIKGNEKYRLYGIATRMY